MRSSRYIACLVAAGALAVPHKGNLQNGNKHYQIVTKFEYVTHYIIGGANDTPQTTCVSQAQKLNFKKLPDVSVATAIYAHPTNVQPVKSPKQDPNRHHVSSSGSSYGLSTDQQEAIDLHNKARKSVGNGPISWDASLAVGAQQWANHMASIGFLQHSKGDYGENLYVGTTSSPYSVSTKAFLAENSQYNGEAISATNYLHFGHYTQCVWKETTKIGMAVSRDSSGVSWVVARYHKPGNMQVAHK
ncbi:Pathogenesis-related 1A [Fusarium mundagurra]|uniref:Pathogenesis-related 1A n=1 Tax=Fusarium mundagurra TaxID=1567541 RepID=A0A8H5XVK5_9HYPO|nr:Pathogenesis-related 1A [Fusarium mundagurra]